MPLIQPRSPAHSLFHLGCYTGNSSPRPPREGILPTPGPATDAGSIRRPDESDRIRIG